MKATSNNDKSTNLSRPGFTLVMEDWAWKSWFFLTSSFFAVIIAILAWVFPSPDWRVFFKWLIVAIIIIFLGIFVLSLLVYCMRLSRYIHELEKKIVDIRRFILSSAGFDSTSLSGTLRYKIAGISNHQGTVNLLIRLPEHSGIKLDSYLDVIVSETDESWGVVQVAEITNSKARAVPYDRRNPSFWDSLEDRMKKDPSPPLGVHLEPFLSDEAKKILRSL